MALLRSQILLKGSDISSLPIQIHETYSKEINCSFNAMDYMLILSQLYYIKTFLKYLKLNENCAIKLYKMIFFIYQLYNYMHIIIHVCTYNNHINVREREREREKT